ncbi:lipase family alpha/beta hydrolase [Sandaracinus amylolyticus]|uniref:Lipase n=1 Tax=Sandaracinus amylolyticus TaxID=927083 RepID=A0A0F6YGL5_9BACT|nr:alpha/beta fold hydrolase [Sandaracinus amylolyticus]AKF04845.1 Lipase [Sandaracinus amylolyticus]
MSAVPVLLVHGIWDRAADLDVLQRGLERRGVGPVRAMDLVPNDGRAPILALADQVAAGAEQLARAHGHDRVDVVGFSMGALVTRTYVQRLGGKSRVRRFVSISGPHRGTATAFALPFAGTRDMRPGSAFLAQLESDTDPWGDVEVHVLYTPFDLMIVPATSSRLRGARSETAMNVALHRWMIEDERAIAKIASILRA